MIRNQLIMTDVMEDISISNLSDTTQIRPSSISGIGTFATEEIKKGEYLDSLIGEKYPLAMIDAVVAAEGLTDGDPLQIDDETYYIIPPLFRLINHSCNPNCGLRNECDLYTIRDIKPGEEITFDYSTSVGINDDWEMNCNCNAAECRKRVAHVLTIPMNILRKYFASNMLQNFIKKQLRNHEALQENKELLEV